MNLLRIVLLVYCTMLLALTGCEDPVVKPDDKVVKGDEQTIITTDTLTLRTSTVQQKALPAAKLDNAVLGNIEDDVYGQSIASFYTEITLPANDVNFDSDLVFDSLVLTLDYSGAYGNIEEPQDVFVYQLSQKIRDSVDYNSDIRFSTNNQLLGWVDDFTPNLADSTTIDGETVPGHMRIRLDQDQFVGKRFIKRVENGFVDKDDFTNYLQGLYVTVDTNLSKGKSFLYFDLASSQSKLTLYYKDSKDNPQQFDFVINDETDWVNNYSHDYNGSFAQSLLNGGQESDSLTMIQGLSGLKTKLEVPYLKSLGNILVNKAALTLTVADNPTPGSDEFPAPVALEPQRAGTNNENLNQDNFTTDYLGGKIFSGTNSLGNNVNRYKFNLSRYFQRAIDGQVENKGLFIIPTEFNSIADRVILHGANNSVNGATLKLTYTKIE